MVLRKKTKIWMDSELLPRDLVFEILRRLPLKSVARFRLVSKLWSSIIRSQDFIRSFPYPSSIHQPSCMFIAINIKQYIGHYDWQFQKRRRCDVHSVHGLISIGYNQQQYITNPSTGRSITLPKVKSRKKIIKSFFGYDPIDCQYKVLCMSKCLQDYSNIRSSDYPNILSSEHQVFTLGGESWRMIECNILHRCKTKGLCINGVLYYGAFTGNDKVEWCIMKFDVRTEKLDILSRLNDYVKAVGSIHSPSLIDYQGKVALAFEFSPHTFDLWVMEDDEKWSNIRISIRPRWQQPAFGDVSLQILGTIHTGEIVFVRCQKSHGNTRHVVYYDHKKDTFRHRTIHFRWGKQFHHFYVMVPCFNYVESAMLL